jgi:hypothetical protein
MLDCRAAWCGPLEDQAGGISPATIKRKFSNGQVYTLPTQAALVKIRVSKEERHQTMNKETGSLIDVKGTEIENPFKIFMCASFLLRSNCLGR